MAHPTKVLIIRFSSIGDIVLTTPVVRMVKTQLDGEVELHYLTKSRFQSVLAHNPYIDHLHTMEKDITEVMPRLKEEAFDYVIDLHKNIRTALIKKQLPALSFTIDKLNFKKWMLVNWGVNKLPKKHIVDRYLDTVKAFGIENDLEGLDYFLDKQKDHVDFGGWEVDVKEGFVAFAIGAAHIGKKMPAEKISEILAKLEMPVVLLGGKEDEEMGNQIVESVKRSDVINACGKYSINQSAFIVSRSEVLVAGDTGLMHIGAAFKRKIVSIWGCTVPEFGMYPYLPDPQSILLEPKHLTKRPCSKLGNRCKYGVDTRCITQIPNTEIIGAVKKLFTARKVPSAQ
ncbi:glycosyltransferase family 9 protein [Halocola ammonii]